MTRCWDIVTVSALLAVTYAGGLMLGKRLGPLGHRAWAVSLFLLWAYLVVLTPPPLTGAYVWCAVPLACAALGALEGRATAVVVGVVTLVLVSQLSRSAGGFDTETVLIPAAAVWGTVALYRTQQRDSTERQRLLDELHSTRDVLGREQRLAGVLAERERIARDLHDTLAQDLSGSLMLLQAAERDWEERPDVARTRLRAVTDGLDAGLADTRRMIRDLTPSVVAEDGLAGALKLLCLRAQAEGTGMEVRFRSVGADSPDLSEQGAVALFRVARGALANVREHARATSVVVTLRQGGDRAELEVCDDGVGFDLARVAGRSPSGRGFGLSAARARLRESGGELAVDSAPQCGTRIQASVPVRSGPSALLPESPTAALR
ncbi:sensor histidine kinase [Streptomyces gramineus]|uniref:sensor histidine kinase n=1 Tax=Streptomyces gramineus TaxID=910542 RepID=UPI00398A930D